MLFAILFAAVGPLAALYLGRRKKWAWTPERFALWSIGLCFGLNLFALPALFLMNVRVIEPYRVGTLAKYVLICAALVALLPFAYDRRERVATLALAGFHRLASEWERFLDRFRRRPEAKPPLKARVRRQFEELRGQSFRVVVRRVFLSRGMDYLLVGAVCIFYLLLIKRNAYWSDEIWSLSAAGMDYASMMGRLAGDVHPPLFYLPLYAIVHIFGNNDVIIKLTTVIPWFATVLAGIFFIKKNFGRGAMYFYVLAMSCVPVFMEYALETRMYSLALCLCIYSGIALNKLLNQPSHKNFLVFSILSLLAAYTHYYALIAVAFLYLGALVFFLRFKKEHALGRWFGYGALMIAGYAKWIPIFLRQMGRVNDGFWVQAYPLSDYLNFFFGDRKRFGVILPILLLMCFVLILLFRRRTARENAWWGMICLGSLLGIVLFGAAYQVAVRPLLYPRYVIMALGLTILGASMAFSLINKPYLVCLACLVLLWSGVTFWPQALGREARAEQTAARTQIFFAENALNDQNVEYISKDGAYYLEPVFDYYLPGSSVDIVVPKDVNLDAVDEKGIWVFSNDEAFQLSDIPASGLKYERYEGYGFEATWFDIYHVWRG
jgi:hypothetical protein